MMKKFFYISALVMLAHPAYALFCPRGYNQIQMGDTLEQVQQQCGKPDKQTETKDDSKAPQQWQYFVKLDPTQQATVNLTVAFAQGKVININVTGTSLVSTSLCGGTVSIGDTLAQVKSACGTAGFVNKGPAQPGNETTITTLTYNTNPPVELTFENGKLVKRK